MILRTNKPKWFRNDFQNFKKLATKNTARFKLDKKDFWPCLLDNTGGLEFDRHYTYHPAWAARMLATLKPESHIDISSILSWATVVSAFIPITYYDFRPAKIQLSNFFSGKQDLTKLSFEDNSIQSLSCMHTVEHIGLGRYGDPLDYDGDLKAIKELCRVTAFGGNLLFVVPVGSHSIIEFNAHRIYSADYIITLFESLGMKLNRFDYIPQGEGNIIENMKSQNIQDKYGCGCFWFQKH